MKRKAFLKNILKTAIALPVFSRIFPLKSEIRKLDSPDGYRLKKYRDLCTGDMKERIQHWE